MCGIIGYLGPRDAVQVIMDGLARLEYRGYDSAGLAVVTDQGDFAVRRAQGKLSRLVAKLATDPVSGHLGMGHTRWATHGRPSETNAHPHLAGDVAVVHNGIIENYLELKNELIQAGHEFSSETDTEIVAHLVANQLKNGAVDLEQAVRRSLRRIRGSYALVILDRRRPDLIIGARKDSPLVLGLGKQGEFFLASDVPAFLAHTNRVVFLNDGDLVVIKGEAYQISDLEGGAQQRPETTISWSPAMAEKAGYKHFMQKEIFEQPRALVDTLAGRAKAGDAEVFLPDLGLDSVALKKVRRLVLLACGTSWHSALVGKFWLEGLAKVPTEVDLGSEFRYRDPLVGPGDLVVAISQSGETADTLAAVREATAKGAQAVAICNVVGSTLTREAAGVIYTHAGPEIGVASTKAFTTQLVVLFLLALHLGRVRGALDDEQSRALINQLVQLPGLVQQALELEQEVVSVAERFAQARDFLFLGRGLCYPVALEGALKLKEISYIHAEGYPAGEMKHGPIALIDQDMPVVVLANQNDVLEKVLSNMEEVRARQGRLIAVTEAGNAAARSLADAAISVPECPNLLAPILLTVPLQLLAYHVAVLRGTDVDQPRNLAKSVTVE
ncbi:MAG: glutamine--fructose-6-phosphate transaminase (isomerizing) [Desulfarculus sp.]|nr:glutamine--fructose-6-phosphate transaminase (isomerizing) [Pseudomonadota bacterium]MBV1715065.1 glutamine--fructose-6-phosphate transaminase (isomerizing) [Desulfarculus sp.]MBU4576034.1 glutamine--fructose-6-phosphate transaminase (isomerizing) [Pseudomonadota bacterium]MBU4599662.1 glutamine--fructose-6-phosphate transaminase (isomerizing) [Pseudomonadota bacterium]MBV1739891.1 glutamine--fructose-6-phosphate transaminase (isomerizing) [Desulfarculus sp.]